MQIDTSVGLCHGNLKPEVIVIDDDNCWIEVDCLRCPVALRRDLPSLQTKAMQRADLLARWRLRQLSNFDYILALNALAGAVDCGLQICGWLMMMIVLWLCRTSNGRSRLSSGSAVGDRFQRGAGRGERRRMARPEPIQVSADERRRAARLYLSFDAAAASRHRCALRLDVLSLCRASHARSRAASIRSRQMGTKRVSIRTSVCVCCIILFIDVKWC
jgi:hypothetical protein